MMDFKTTLLAGAACLALVSLPAAATSSNVVALVAARAAAEARATPAVVATDLPRMTAEQIVVRNAAARGGLAAWQRINSMSMSGKLDAGKVRKDGGAIATSYASKLERAKGKAELRKALDNGTFEAKAEQVIQLPFMMDLKRPSLQRLEVPFQAKTAVQVYDGKNGWKLRPFLGRHEVEPFTADELKMAASQQQLDGALINHQAKGTKVDLVGGEMVDGKGAYKLKLTLKNGEVRNTWVDAQTFLDVKIEGAPRHWDGKMRTVSTYFRDYKPVDGLMIAHRLETVVQGVLGSENIYVEKVALNPVLDASRFTKPE